MNYTPVHLQCSEVKSKTRLHSGPLAAGALIVSISLTMQSCSRDSSPATSENNTDNRQMAPTQSAGAKSFYGSFKQPIDVARVTELGRALFFDAKLSASGTVACATCHSPDAAYGPPNGSPIQTAGRNSREAGLRAVPSLRYRQSIPPFTEHFHDNEDDSLDQGPAGGFTWDGRAQSSHDQARLPLLSPLEMANDSEESVVAKVEGAAYAEEFRKAFGAQVFADRALAFKGVQFALEVFQQSPADFYPFSSKFDAFLRGTAELSEQERRGLDLFNAEEKGNCASCHQTAVMGGALPILSDFGFIAIGVPRNASIPANSDRTYFDLGLCGPLRTDFSDRGDYCGLFRTPSLRNAGIRKTFFHNGAMDTLEKVVEFYVQRDTNPEKWYSKRANGQVNLFDDLPANYRENLNVDPPFDRKRGDKPAMDASEIKDVVAFLNTLTDGYVSKDELKAKP